MSRTPLRSLTALRPTRLVTRARPGAIHLVTALALLAGAAYLVWRIAFTVGGAPLWLSVPLVAAEVLGWAQLAHLALEAWSVPGPAAEGAAVEGTRQVVVLAAGAPAEEVERTLLGCRELEGAPPVLVARLAGDPGIAPLCGHLGATVAEVADATTGAALGAATADLVLLVGAGAVPAHDALEQAAWRMGATGAVAVQCRAEATDPGIAGAVSGGGGGTLLQRVINPSLGARGAVLAQAGAGLLVRREAATHALGGRSGLRAAAALLSGGGRVAFAPAAVVRTTSCASLEGYLDATGRASRSGLGLLVAPEGPVRGRGLGVTRRLLLAGPGLRALAGPRMLVLLAVLAGTLVSGRAPVDAPLWLLAAAWGVWVVLATGAWVALARGTRAVGDRTRSAMRLMGKECGALLRALAGRPAAHRARPARRGVAALSRLGTLVAALVAVDAALALRGVAQHVDLGLPLMPRGLMWATAAFAVLAALLMLDVLQLVVLHRQERRVARMAVDLPARLDGTPARIVDLTPSGVRIAGTSSAARPGDAVAVAFELPGRDGAPVALELRGVVRSARGGSLGVELREVPPDAHEALATYYWVTRPARLRAGLDAPAQAVPADGGAPLLGRPLSALSRVATVVGAAGLVLALLPASAQAATTSAKVTLKSPLVSPGIGSFGRYNINISNIAAPGFPFLAGDKRAHCVEYDQGAATGAGELNTEGNLALRNDAGGAAGNARVKWLMLSDYASETAPGSLTAAKQVAAHQSAVWALTNPTAALGSVANVRNPGDADAFARAKALYAAVTAAGFSATWVDQDAALTADATPVCAGGTAHRTVTVSGAAWTTVTLTVPAGAAIWVDGASKGTQASVQLDGDGRVDVQVAATDPGAVTLTASFQVPTLVQSRNGPNKTSQDFVYLEFQTVSRTVALTFLDCKALTVDKTVAPRYTRTFTWDVQKAAGVQSPVITTADQVTVPYTVTVTRTGATDSGFAVEGVITVRNPNAFGVSGVTVTDRIAGGPVCSVTGGTVGTLAAGATAALDYACALPAKADGTNVATVTWARPGLADGTASVQKAFAFGAPTTLVHPTVVLTDTAAEFAAKFGSDVTVSADEATPKAFTYDRVLDVPSGREACATYDNTARIAHPGGQPFDEAAASVTACRQTEDLVVTKTAEASYTRTYDWDIAKTATPERQSAAGDHATVAYEVRLTRSGPVDSGYAVAGTITLTNPNPFPVEGVEVTDALPGATCAVDGGASAVVTVPARQGRQNGTATVPYTCARPDKADGTNTATATWTFTAPQAEQAGGTPGPHSATGTAEVVFGAPTTVRNATVRVTDTPAGQDPVVLDPALGASHTFAYTRDVDLPAVGCRRVENVARFAATDGDDAGEADASSVVCRKGEDLVVTKTAVPSFTRTYDWTVTKTAAPATVTLTDAATPTGRVTYTVVATKLAGTDSGWAVAGAITVANPNPFAVEGVQVTDELPGATCKLADDAALTVPANGSASVAYACAFAAEPAAGLTNTATARWDADRYVTPSGTASGTAPVAFTQPTDLVNDAVKVVDAFDGGAEQVLAAEITASQTFTQSRDLAAPADGCTTYANIAAVVGVGSPAFRREAAAIAKACRSVPPTPPTSSTTGSTPEPPATPSGSPSSTVAPVVTTPVTPAGTPVARRARIAVTKRAPRRATAGQVVPYVITVRNTGRVTLRGVVLADTLPANTSLTGRVGGAKLRRGTLTWRVGTLRPGAERVVRVRLRLDAAARGSRCNVAKATAAGVPRASATACTVVAPVASRVTPAVTG